MERSTRQLFNRWDTGPITAALNARLPGRSGGISSTQRGELAGENSSSWDSIRSAISRSFLSQSPDAGWLRSTGAPQVSQLPRMEAGGGVGRGISSISSSSPFSSIRSMGASSGGMRTVGGLGTTGSSPLSRFHGESQGRIAAQRAAEAAAQQGQPGGSTGGSMGNPTGGNWPNVNRWNTQIQAAIDRVAREFGITVPANIVKAVMELESGGNHVGCNSSGYCGLMQTGPGSNISNYNHAYNMTPEGNLYYGVQELANWYKATGSWDDAPIAYFSGYNYNKPWVSDGHYTVADYRAHIARNLTALNSGGQSSWGGGGTGGGLSTMFPGRVSGFDFGVQSGNGLYGYGTAYGLNGSQHTGMDIMMPMYTPIYAPANARVVCVGCWRNDHLGGGVGRIELEMPDGARVLYDHSNSATVQVGQTVSAGQMIGRSGGMYSPHIHLEVRVPDGSTSSGYRLVDPAAYFGGMVGGGGGTGAPATPAYETATQRLLRLMGRSF